MISHEQNNHEQRKTKMISRFKGTGNNKKGRQRTWKKTESSHDNLYVKGYNMKRIDQGMDKEHKMHTI